jgi:predicted GNAT family acetyltransferase
MADHDGARAIGIAGKIYQTALSEVREENCRLAEMCQRAFFATLQQRL